MSTKLAPHCQWAHGPSQFDEGVFSTWRPPSMKTIFSSDDHILGLEIAAKYVANNGPIVIRHHPISEERIPNDIGQAREHGRQQARWIIATLLPVARAQVPGIDVSRLVWEGRNEPNIWPEPDYSERPDCVTAYYCSFADTLHTAGLKCGWFNFSVGWPGNHGVPDAPPDWSPFMDFTSHFVNGDYLHLHEYWDSSGPQKMWPWWAGAYTRCPANVPIMITECGLTDELIGVDKLVAGWKVRFGGNVEYAAQQYTNQLAWYDNELHKDARIVAAHIFDYDYYQPWGNFDIRDETFLRVFLPYVVGLPVSHGVWGTAKLTPYKALVEKYANGVRIDPKVVGTIIMLESGADPNAISPAGAVGLMQVMPKEAGPAFADRPTKQELLDPETNIKWGVAILRAARDVTRTLEHALAKYYGGWGLYNVVSNPPTYETYAAYVEKYRVWNEYLRAFIKNWKIWSPEECPVKEQVPLPNPGPSPTPPPIDLDAIRWNAEETARKLEATIAGYELQIQQLKAIRQQLLDNVIKPLEH